MTIKIHRVGIHLVRTNLCHNKKRQVQGYHLVLKNFSTEVNAQGVKKEEKIEFNPSLIYASKNIFPQPTVLPVETDSQNFQKSIKVSPEAEEIFHPPTYIKNDAHVSGLDAYHELYRQSMEEPNEFWKSVAKELHFEKWSDKGLEYNFDHQKGEVFVKFMEGAKTNMAYNCLERNIQKGLGSKIAYIWEGNEPGDQMTITYQELLDQVVKFAEVLRTKGVKKGDVVAIYLPMTIELPIAMLACARIGAIHSVVFAGFSSDALANRIHQAKAKILITADGFYRGHKAIDLKTLADKAFSICHDQGHDIDSVIMVEHLKRIRTPKGAIPPEIKINKKTDSLWNKEMEAASSKNLQTSKIEWNDSEDPLFILYTSGSTGTPKGLVHTTTGYMTYAYEAAKKIFDSKPDDVFWCTADIGWITGHTFGVYGALLNGMTSVLFEGVPNYPDASRMWQLVEKYKVSKLYTSPTAVRSLMDCPTEMVTDYSRDTLKILGVVGEPINRPAWRWLHKVVGGEKCAIVDTYWQTETGGPMLTPLPGATPTKPGSATMPFFGVDPVLVDDQGVAKKGQVDGNLCFARAWPGMARTIWGDHTRFIKTYFSTFPGLYFTGDGARRDHDSYYWVGGRVDDKLNVSGHLLSTSEIECVLTHHPTVQEAAVVAAPHPSKGQVPYAFVVLKQSKTLTADLIHEIKQEVRNKIGPFAAPEVVHGACGLPKTRSGKITRRILRIIAEGDDKANLGDTSTLIDEQVIAHLWETRPDVQFCK